MLKKYIINREFNRLELLDTRFYMDDKGQKFPSVTTILECYPKGPQFYEWLKQQGANAEEILDEAGRLGSNVHQLAEDFDNHLPVSLLNESGEPQYKLKDWSYFERYVDFRTRFEADILHNELNMCSAELGFGGTLDRVFRMGGKNILLDIKTSNYLHTHFWCQLAGYNELFNQFHPDTKIDDIAILHLNAKTRTNGKNGDIQGVGWKMEFAPKSINYYWKLFLSVKQTWLEEYGDMIPKQVSYNLVHQLNSKPIKKELNGTGKT